MLGLPPDNPWDHPRQCNGLDRATGQFAVFGNLLACSVLPLERIEILMASILKLGHITGLCGSLGSLSIKNELALSWMDESGVNSLGKCTARNPWGMQALVWEGALRAQCTQDVFQILGRC